MKQIILHGALGARFGESFSLDVRDPAEAVRALGVQLKGFREALEAGHWHVMRGPLDNGDDLNEEGLTVALGNQSEIHIMPAVEGAGDGLGNIIAGALLVAAAFYTGGASLAAWGTLSSGLAIAGGGMALGGIIQMTTNLPGADYNDRESPAERPSFLFDGPVNTSTQGLPVPVIYGRVRVGSVVISAGMTAEELDE
ncbi:hypothetical protein [Vreelandella glaciei]|uniref:tail assembly protein n=1 Tax=Vreelandella glaciei TaxID=186761 RepID=UPI0030033C75